MATPVRGSVYRFAVLGSFMLIIAANQLLWITFAAVTRDAASLYGVSELAIGLLSLVFMGVFLVLSIPASWLIDTAGIRLGVGVGAVLTGLFGLGRGIGASSYAWVLAAQIGIAAGQPFLLNAVSKVAGRWFPPGERATAAGLGSLAMYVGILAGLVLTPALVRRFDLVTTLRAYGVFAAVAAATFLLVARERPREPVGREERSLVFDGLRSTLRQRDFRLLLVLFFIGLGLFNAVTTWIEDIVRPRGFSADVAGWAGGMMIIGGIVGAVVVPLWSDRTGRRVPFLVLALVGATPGLVGVAFAQNTAVLLVAAFVLGAFLLASGPLGFQYAAEVTHPAPEGTSNGLLLLSGQISGIAFIVGMDALRAPSGAMTPSLIALSVLLAASACLATRLREPTTGGLPAASTGSRPRSR